MSASLTLRIFEEGDAARINGIGKSSRNSWDFAERGDWIEARAEIVADEEAGRGMRLLNGKYAPWKQLLDFFSKFKRRGHIVFAIRP